MQRIQRSVPLPQLSARRLWRSVWRPAHVVLRPQSRGRITGESGSTWKPGAASQNPA